MKENNNDNDNNNDSDNYNDNNNKNINNNFANINNAAASLSSIREPTVFALVDACGGTVRDMSLSLRQRA